MRLNMDLISEACPIRLGEAIVERWICLSWKERSSMEDSLRLRRATVQEIQLELIRRTQFNALDGRQVVDSLFRHREFWPAILLERPGLPEGCWSSSRREWPRRRDAIVYN